MNVRVAIVDDEPPARAKLRRLLQARPTWRIVGEADDVAGALALLRGGIEVLFLDIRLGTENGFDVLARAAPPYPLVVFTTAYHEHALQAFEVAALDYLLKPFDRGRFERALERVDQRLADGGEGDGERLRRLDPALAPPRLQRFVVHERGGSRVVPLADVQRLSAAGNYVELHTAARRHLVRATLSRLALRLDPAQFLRVHRSHLVRADFIATVSPHAHGDQRLVLRDGTELLLSRRYRAALPPGWR